MRSNSKRLRVSYPESDTDADAESNAEASMTDDTSNAVPSTSRSSTSKDANTYVNVFTEDILPVILDNLQILTPTDLLHFRLVNRCWRDAATCVLLKRNASDIALKIGQVTYNRVVNIESYEQLMGLQEDDHDHAPPVFRCCNARPPFSLLPDLIQIISTSPKFPSNSIKFLPGCEKALSNLTSSPAKDKYELEEDELLRLFSLYGKKIQKLTFSSEISILSVRNLLFVHLPNLTCLDLSNFTKFASTTNEPINPNEVFYFPLLSQNSNSNLNQTLKLKRIYAATEQFPNTKKILFLQNILILSRNLQAVRAVNATLLCIFLKMKKAHLVTCLQYNPPNHPPLFHFLAQFCGIQKPFPLHKLNELTITFSNMNESPASYDRATAVLNMILKGSKDTLEYLEIHVNPKHFLVNIKIPPMGKLKCLKLVKENASFALELQSREAAEERARLAHQNIPVDQSVYDMHVFQFENQQDPNRIPLDYFPQLSKVVLDVDPGSVNTYNRLLALFALEHPGIDDGSIVAGDIVPSVTTLEMTAFPDVDNKLGQLFPNLRNLKIKCEQGSKLYNWVWRAFPKLEIFEIDNFVPVERKGIDGFFTGICHKLCTQFDRNDKAAAKLEFSPGQIHFLRTQPYIGDCANLREFTIKFGGKLSNISKMTGLRTFAGISNQTKICFSFESANLSEQEMTEIRKHIKHVAPYIGIRP